jgi:hypothetical protein
MNRTCQICGRHEKCIQNFSYKPKQKGPLQTSVGGRIILKKVLKETRSEDVNCIQLAQDRVQQHVFGFHGRCIIL